jgi:hypothetical protein
MNTHKNILFACHCDKIYEIPKIRGNINKKDYDADKVFQNITYVDIVPECKTWEDIPSNSMDEIWTIGCPLSFIFNNIINNAMMYIDEGLFNDGIRILKTGGKLYILFRNLSYLNSNFQRQIENLSHHVFKYEQNIGNVLISYELLTNLPYYVHNGHKSYHPSQIIVIITKINNTTGGKKHKSKRKKYATKRRRNKTYHKRKIANNN